MKLKGVFLLLLLAAHIYVNALTIKKVELLPEIKELLDISFVDIRQIDSNAYAALVAINSPINKDSQEIGKKAILENIKLLKNSIKKQDYYSFMDAIDIVAEKYYGDLNPIVINTLAYTFACADLDNNHCIEQVIIDKDKINTILHNNKPILDRYKNYIKLMNYDTYYFAIDVTTLTRVRWLSSLQLLEAIIAIENKKIDDGFKLLQAEIDFNKKVLSGNIDAMTYKMTIRRLLVTYHVIDVLLDSPLMVSEFDNNKLSKLLEPFSTTEQSAISNVLKNMRNIKLLEMYTYSLDHYLEVLEHNKIKYNEQEVRKNFNKNMILNSYYEKMNSYIQSGELFLPKSSNYYLNHIYNKHNNSIVDAKEIDANTLLANIALRDAIDDHLIFTRFYDLVSYRALLEIKLKIKRLGITKNQVPDFLKRLGKQAVNPYNQRPFEWDAENQRLSTDYLEHTPELLNKKLSVFIRFNH